MIETITNKINSFDTYFAMSDSNAVFDKWSQIKIDIKQVLKSMTIEQLQEVKQGLKDMDMVNLHFKAYFENLPVVKKVKSYKSEIMTAAWSMLKKGLFTSISGALKAAWNRYKLVSKLRNGIAYFSFAKATGELREAIGTLRNGNFSYEAKTDNKETNLSIIKYYDLEKRAFRSVRIDRLIEIAA